MIERNLRLLRQLLGNRLGGGGRCVRRLGSKIKVVERDLVQRRLITRELLLERLRLLLGYFVQQVERLRWHKVNLRLRGFGHGVDRHHVGHLGRNKIDVHVRCFLGLRYFLGRHLLAGPLGRSKLCSRWRGKRSEHIQGCDLGHGHVARGAQRQQLATQAQAVGRLAEVCRVPLLGDSIGNVFYPAAKGQHGSPREGD